mgnify:CR=1 FL=1
MCVCCGYNLFQWLEQSRNGSRDILSLGVVLILSLEVVLILSLGVVIILSLGGGTICMWLNLFMAFYMFWRSSPVALWRSSPREWWWTTTSVTFFSPAFLTYRGAFCGNLAKDLSTFEKKTKYKYIIKNSVSSTVRKMIENNPIFKHILHV